MSTRIQLLMIVLFLAPIVTVLAINQGAIMEDMTPRPENGYMIYVTADR